MAAVKHTKGVVDLTFLDIEEEEHMTVLLDRLPRSAICKLDLSASLQPGSPGHDGTGNGSASPSKRRQSETITSIRLGNNNIQSIDIIYKSINAALDTSTILWLDLAFNNITNICGKIAENFPFLETLNLHANNIKNFKEVKKLTSVTTLRALSLPHHYLFFYIRIKATTSRRIDLEMAENVGIEIV
jgi:hypothetical protein